MLITINVTFAKIWQSEQLKFQRLGVYFWNTLVSVDDKGCYFWNSTSWIKCHNRRNCTLYLFARLQSSSLVYHDIFLFFPFVFSFSHLVFYQYIHLYKRNLLTWKLKCIGVNQLETNSLFICGAMGYLLVRVQISQRGS